MKTYNIVKLGKGAYLDIRIGGRMTSKEYYKTLKDLNEEVKKLRAQGYIESK